MSQAYLRIYYIVKLTFQISVENIKYSINIFEKIGYPLRKKYGYIPTYYSQKINPMCNEVFISKI